MEFLILMVLLYFLPTILAIVRYPTHDPFGIFLVNFFLGWTVIGRWVAFIWALAANGTSQEFRRVPVSSGRFCSQCGALSPYGAHFCSACGRVV